LRIFEAHGWGRPRSVELFATQAGPDIFTKPLPREKIQKLREALGVQEQH